MLISYTNVTWPENWYCSISCAKLGSNCLSVHFLHCNNELSLCLLVPGRRKLFVFILDEHPKVVRISPKGLPCQRITFELYKINNQILSLSAAAIETKVLHSNLFIEKVFRIQNKYLLLLRLTGNSSTLTRIPRLVLLLKVGTEE